MGLLDLFFPKRCIGCKAIGSYICANCFAHISFTTHSLCLVCNKASLDGRTHPGCYTKYCIDGAFASIAYKGIVKKLIYRYKYQPFLSDLTGILVDLFYEGIIQYEVVSQLLSRNPLFVPIPLHPSRYRERGYNQAELLARGLAEQVHCTINKSLVRTKKTATQTLFARDDRMQNIKDAFSVVSLKEPIKGREIVLIDDVYTSGATFKEAANVLKHAGAGKVWGIALAHEE